MDRKSGSMIIALAMIVLAAASAAGEMPGNTANPQAVQEVLAGKRATANAAWWGFQEEDSTEALQAAINSGAKRVLVPNMTKDWIVRPLKLAGHQELILEDGVVITAKRGEYRGSGDSLLNARDISDLVIRGYGATVRMQKEDYISGDLLDRLGWNRWFGAYKKAEGRMTLKLRGATDVGVYGLTLRDSGGDGIYVQDCKNIRIQDVVCDNNYRQGISVIEVDGLTVENSVFKNTWGTPPAAGLDIEPDHPTQGIRHVAFRNCRFEDNYGDGIELNLARMRSEAGDVSILFDNCRVSSRRGTGIRVSKVRDDVGGLIEFRNCVVENTEGYGIKVNDKSAAAARVKFVNCAVRNVANNRKYSGAWTPVWIGIGAAANSAKQQGGIEFVNCSVEDRYDRPLITVDEPDGEYSLVDVTGNINGRNPFGVRTALGKKHERVTLAVTESER